MTTIVVVAPNLRAADQFVVVIDAGHGGKDNGAVANGLKEKDINLGVAKKLSSYLKKNVKGVKIIMTRDKDEFISLQERADIANKAHANLFISIHTNSVAESNPNRTKVAGASTHVLGTSKDEKNLEVTRRENSVIKYEKNYKEKYENFDPDSDESYIIFEMVQKKNVQNSIDLAELIQTGLYKHAGRRNRGVHQNGFWVLWATSMPSVLVELDFICNPNSSKYLGSSKGQTELAKGIGEAVKTYIDRSTKMAQAQATQDEKVEASPIAGDYAVLTAAPTVDDRTVGSAPKPAKTATPAKRRRRSEASKSRSEKRVVETKEIQVATTQQQSTLTAQAKPAQQARQQEKTVTQQPPAKKAKPAGKAKKPKSNREKKVKQPAKQTAKATPAASEKQIDKNQATEKKQVAQKKKEDKGKRKEDKKKKQSAKPVRKGTATANPVTAQATISISGGKTVNVKKPRLNP